MLGRNLIEACSNQQQQRLKQQRLKQQILKHESEAALKHEIEATLKHQLPILKDGEILKATENKPKSLLDDLMIDEKKFMTTELMPEEIDCILNRHISLMEEFHMSPECLNDHEDDDDAGRGEQYDEAAGQCELHIDYSSLPQLNGITENVYSKRAMQLGKYRLGTDIDDNDITIWVSVENVTDVPPICVQNYASTLSEWNTKSFLPTLRHVDCKNKILIVDAYKWSMADIAVEKSIPLFEIDQVDPALIPFVKEWKQQVWRLTPSFKKTCKSVIRGLMGLADIGKPIFSLAADGVVFEDEDTTFQNPKFVDLYEFNGTCDAHLVFCNFLLDVINLRFGLKCKTCFSGDTFAMLKDLLTLDLLDMFRLPRFSGEKILEHPALMSVAEKIGKFTDIRTYVKDNQDYLDDPQSSGVGFEWMSEAENHLLLGAMFIKPCDTYNDEVPSFVDFVTNTVEDFNTNIQHALVNKEDIIQKFSRFSQKQINSVTNLHMNQVHELIERVFPQGYTYVFRTEIPDYWMESKPTLE